MFKLIILIIAYVAAVWAVPTFLHHGDGVDFATISTAPVFAAGIQTHLHPETVQYQEHTIAKVGDFIQKIPAAVSDHRSTVIHNQADIVTPIVAPAVKTNTLQILKAYSHPVVYTAAAATPVISVLREHH